MRARACSTSSSICPAPLCPQELDPLSSAFQAAGLPAATAFLALLYSPQAATPAHLADLAAAGTLASVALLAYKLRAGALLKSIEVHLQGKVGGAAPHSMARGASRRGH